MASSHFRRDSARVKDSASSIASANPQKGLVNDEIAEVSPSYRPTTAISPLPARSGRKAVALPELHRWTVGYRYRYMERHYPHAARQRPEPPPVPFLPLQGRWLHRAGFTIGTSVCVLVTPGRLVLEVTERT